MRSRSRPRSKDRSLFWQSDKETDALTYDGPHSHANRRNKACRINKKKNTHTLSPGGPLFCFYHFAGTRQHFTIKPPATHTTACTTTPPRATTNVRAGALVPPPPCLGGRITRVGPLSIPTVHPCPCEGVGGSPQCDHKTTWTRQPTSPTIFTGR